MKTVLADLDFLEDCTEDIACTYVGPSADSEISHLQINWQREARALTPFSDLMLILFFLMKLRTYLIILNIDSYTKLKSCKYCNILGLKLVNCTRPGLFENHSENLESRASITYWILSG